MSGPGTGTPGAPAGERATEARCKGSRGAGARRAVLLLPAGPALLLGLDAALILLELPAPLTAERLPEVHGVLLVLGFAGTLVALERAVALGARWAYLSPACLGAGGLLLAAPVDLRAGRLLLVAGTALLLVLYTRFWKRQPGAALLVQGAGAVAALGAALLWLGGLDVPRLLPWLAAFLVLTIAGERLELARVALLAPRTEDGFLAASGAVLAGAVVTLLWPGTGSALLGLALLALVGWLTAHDVARRMLRSAGLPRFSAACLLAGYAWLGLAGALWLVGGPVAEGPRYDAVVHAVFLGFVLSMIMAHAPVILPAVLRRPLPYHRVLAGPAWLLHLSLALRVLIGDLRGPETAWRLGGALNITAVLLFVVLAATLSVRAGRARPGAAGGREGTRPDGAARPAPRGSAPVTDPGPADGGGRPDVDEGSRGTVPAPDGAPGAAGTDAGPAPDGVPMAVPVGGGTGEETGPGNHRAGDSRSPGTAPARGAGTAAGSGPARPAPGTPDPVPGAAPSTPGRAPGTEHPEVPR
ncbi:hypothetical protein KBZ10_27365 [Streptomyces sp. F63]|uniref:hypothetical protein n=1 Tax=Streptomyces sp. F63 TaxID=2824887 RepID=UPI001B38C0B9|nr:hypothetical protein [Streptomyces sp. F63]MBQ0988165.1 hypothetical protein [Streptomyces sp. F63]